MLQQVKLAEERWKERIAAPLAPFPADARAIIYKPSRSATTSGKARTREWKLRFEPRMPRYIEPLMGWTGHDDPLAQVELSFPSMEAAMRYARSQRLDYTVQGHPHAGADIHRVKNVKPIGFADAQSTTRSRAQCSGHEPGAGTIHNNVQSGNAPWLSYGAPQDVLRDPALSQSEKRDALRRWALEAYLTESTPSADATPHPSRLDGVIDALIALDEPELRRFIERASRSAPEGRPLAA